MPHDLVTTPQRGLIRMDDIEEPWLTWHFSLRTGGSFRTMRFGLRRRIPRETLFPRSMFWICDLVTECRCNNPHHAVGILWIVGDEREEGAQATVYLIEEAKAPHYLPKVLRFLRNTYGLRRLP